MPYPPLKPGTSLCGTPKPLGECPLLSPIQAGGLAAIFKVLASDTRLRLLHALVRAAGDAGSEDGTLCVGELAAAIGMKSQAVSNQLQRLTDLGIVTFRRDGSNIRYQVVDRCVVGLLQQGWCLMDEVQSASGGCDS